jgi:hypothetical protein
MIMSKPAEVGWPFVRIEPMVVRCLVCGWVGSVNAMSRRAHLRSRRHLEAKGEAPPEG